MQNHEMELFEYVGRRASGAGTPTNNWLTFRHLAKPLEPSVYDRYGGGLRAVIDTRDDRRFDVYRDDGTVDRDMLCLPPDMCYCFQKVGEPCESCGFGWCDENDLARCVGCDILLCPNCAHEERGQGSIAPSQPVHNLDGKGAFPCESLLELCDDCEERTCYLKDMRRCVGCSLSSCVLVAPMRRCTSSTAVKPLPNSSTNWMVQATLNAATTNELMAFASEEVE
jgi:hypothetical protein